MIHRTAFPDITTFFILPILSLVAGTFSAYPNCPVPSASAILEALPVIFSLILI